MTTKFTAPVDDTYLKSRLATLSVSGEQNRFTLTNGESITFFSADEEGNIVINYFNLQGNQYFWKKPSTKNARHFQRIRLRRENDGQKYSQPQGSPQFPFFTSNVIKKFKEKTPIKTLFIVEGEFKAFKGSLCGLDIIGIPSIHGFYSKELKGKLHEDIEALIVGCNVKQVVFIADADVLTSHWAEGKDLAKRASSFYSAIKNFRESLTLLISNPIDLITFTHLLPKFEREDAKGLDDLLCTYTSVHDKIIADLNKLHLATDYFRGFILNDINADLPKIFKYLGLNSPGEFFETYKDHIDDKQFVFRGKSYKWNPDKQGIEEIRSEIPYIRVGVKYYKKIYTPRADGETTLSLKEWTRTCIEMDHGKDYLKQIEKFEDWCYVPEHITYRQSINEGGQWFYNRYYPLKYLPAPGTCESIRQFVQHIFAEHLEQGLDYLQLLYTKPQQILPVLCLVSEQRNTGKTTFLNFLNTIFGGNATINRNEDFESQFNSGWAGKLIIAVDETFIDRQKIYERIKSLSTGKTLKVEAKGQDSSDAEFFGKVILCSNNEDSFIPVDGSEIRFWVRKIVPFKSEDPHLLTKLTPEIPAFLQFLLDRKLVTQQKTRMWFSQSDIQTDALNNIVQKNKTYLEKELTEQLTEVLLDCDIDEVKYTLNDLIAMLAKSGLKSVHQFKLKELINRKWKLEHKNSSYTKWFYTDIGEKNCFSTKGKYFTFTRSLFGLANKDEEKNNDVDNSEKAEKAVDKLINGELPF